MEKLYDRPQSYHTTFEGRRAKRRAGTKIWLKYVLYLKSAINMNFVDGDERCIKYSYFFSDINQNGLCCSSFIFSGFSVFTHDHDKKWGNFCNFVTLSEHIDFKSVIRLRNWLQTFFGFVTFVTGAFLRGLCHFCFNKNGGRLQKLQT
jgi:hypothetical protein